jgi:hypothetical protein
MGNNELTSDENILVKVDQNNLMYIDPNSVVVNGSVQPRGIKQENLVMYLNLEADIIPRSTLIATNDKNTLTSIAKGTLNFLKNNDGGDYDTTWTNSFLQTEEKTTKVNLGSLSNFQDFTIPTGEYYQSDKTEQSFGIDSVSITVKGANFIPQVTINFIDVRGKTLFESPENSPYKAFFHIPWPIFYLTVKGYYGKAIRYRLHLVKFSTKFNDTTGNFESATTFVGSTYAWMSDIPLKGVLNAPYMFLSETTKDGKFNGNLGVYEKKVSKTSRGYRMLESVFSEMKQKGLIDKEVPVKTVREIGVIAKTLDKILEKEIFDGVVDPKVLAGIKDFQEIIINFENSIKEWGGKRLSKDPKPINGKIYYYLNGKDETRTSNEWIIDVNKQGSLEYIIESFKKQIKDSALFNTSLNKTNNKTTVYFTYKNIDTINKYFTKDGNFYLVSIEDNSTDGKSDGSLLGDIYLIKHQFIEEKKKVEELIEKRMNEVIKSPDKGIGFAPTVRNLFGILLASAEVYVRLMKEVHSDAFLVGDERKKLLSNFTDESVGQPIYPWPEIKKQVGDKKEKVIAYPGEQDLQTKLHSYDKRLWPEVNFVEEFIGVSTNLYDPLSEKEGGVNKINYVFDGNSDIKQIKKITSLTTISDDIIPYVDKTFSSFLYEMWERAYYFTLFDSFNTDTIKELANLEFNNIKESIKEDIDLVGLLKNSIKSYNDLVNFLKTTSQFERHPYQQDKLPTVPYIKDLLDSPFKIEQYVSNQIKPTDDNLYVNLSKNLKNYVPEPYRKNIFPFNSVLYLSYLNQDKFTDDEFKFSNNLEVNNVDGFINTSRKTDVWVKDGFADKLFSRKLKINNSKINILNTPYFHKQLFNDFNKNGGYSKYIGSAYLLLNSIPFIELSDKVNFSKETGTTPIRLSSIFREVGSTHLIPYHLIVKWGSIYHRYKNYILNGTDILDGFLTSGNTTTNVNGSVLFDNNSGTTFTINTTGVTYSTNKDIGIHPYYDGVYHQIVNGYSHYDVSLGNTSFSTNVTNKAIRETQRTQNGFRYWTGFVDNAKFDLKDKRYTLLPCDGANIYINTTNTGTTSTINTDTFDKGQQYYLRTIWENDYINDDFSGLTFPSYNEYHRTYVSGTTRTNDDIYSIDNNYRKVFDLIGTFSPKILNEFEYIFLEFASEKTKDEITYKRFNKVSYYKFQDLLKDITSVIKFDSDNNLDDTLLIPILKIRQSDNLNDVSKNILKPENLLKFTIGNPKEIDTYLYAGFSLLDSHSTFTYNGYNSSQLTPTTQRYLNLYLGEFPHTTGTFTDHYKNFFVVNDVELSEYNIIQFRPLILMYAGYVTAGGVNNKTNFQEYIKNSIYRGGMFNILTNTPNPTSGAPLGHNFRLANFLQFLIGNFKKLDTPQITGNNNIIGGYNNDLLKIELYNFFKSFNDKWVAGNSLGQRLLMEEFLFLDKANRDIGDQVFLNLDRFINLLDQKNNKLDLYGAIGSIIAGTGFDMRALPSYVNFYGRTIGTSSSSKITPSKNIAANVFGNFLEVDYQESTPKIILQYVGPVSKYPEMSDSKKYLFKDDSFDVSNVNNNPLLITTPSVFNDVDYAKSNKVVAFEVSFGDQNQGIFKGIQLDQASLKNTSESFVVMENLARSESGNGVYNVDIGLYDIYRQASYTCDVTMMGDVMIQPTMFFYLKNVPMFKGSYWITEVSHGIRNNNIITTFKGTRIPMTPLPDPKDSFMSSFKPLFDKIINTAVAKVNNEDKRSKTIQPVSTPYGNFDTDPVVPIKGYEELIKDAQINEFGVPYNGYGNELYIQKVKLSGEEWFRTRVLLMGSKNYPISDDTTMSLVSKLPDTKPLTWGEIKDKSEDFEFYSLKFQQSNTITPSKILSSNTTFKTVNRDGKEKSREHNVKYSLTGSVGSRTVKGPINVGPNVEGYGIGMSKKLMLKLGLVEGDVVYFQM